MKRSHALTALLTLGLVCFSAPARARGEGKGRRVVVLSPHPDEVSARLVRELSAVALDPTIAAGNGSCDEAQIKGLADSTHAPSVVCIGDKDLAVWVTDADGLRMREQIPWASAQASAADPAIVQATEVVRARLAQLPPDAAAPAAETAPAPVVVTADATEPKDVAAKPPAQRPPGNTPRLIVGAGMTSVLSPGYQPTWGVGMEAALGISRHASIVVNAVVPVSSAQFDDSSSSASAHTTEVGAGFQVPLLAPDSRLIPRLGAGWGIVHMHTQPITVPTDGHSVGHEEDLVSPYLYLDAALSARLYGPLRLTLASSALGTPARFHVRMNGTDHGTFGGLVALSQLRVEVQLP